jgi:glucan phosphoethanolaminetransferase (alkaline phosphatase superfamily)
MKNHTSKDQDANSPQKKLPGFTWWQSEWVSSLILVAAFLPLTLPNLWAGKWRHSLFQLALWLAVFGCRRWAVLLLIPFYLMTPILVFVSQHYGPADLNLLASVRGSTSSEKTAFFQIVPADYYWLYFLMLVPVLAYLIIRRSARRQTPAKIRWLCLLVAAGFLFSWCIKSYQSRWHGDTLFGSVLVQHVGRYQPLGFPVSLALAALDVDGQHQAALQRANFNYGATSAEKIDTVVFVIGESSRADHWHINGYSRSTTPELERIPDLISFSNVMSLAPNTVLSWPFIFTPKTPGDSAHWTTQKSFISAFKEAGYDTYFVSFYMDQNSPKTDPLANIVFDADTVINGLAGIGKKSTDPAMLPAIRKILAAKGPKLVVVSTQGSHTGFEGVLPLKYNYFKPSVMSGNRTPEAWLNGYDDTIRMTDDFLASIISQLQAQGSRAVLFYVSDHGLACCDPGEKFLGQAFIKPEYRPACIAWASKAFLADSGDQRRFNLGRQHAAASVTTDYILHSFLDLCGIQTKILDQSKSLFNSSLAPPVKRQVEDFQGHWLDYDQVPNSMN